MMSSWIMDKYYLNIPLETRFVKEVERPDRSLLGFDPS